MPVAFAVLICGDGAQELLDRAEPELPLGMGASPQPCRAGWSAGDRLLLFTDGLVEARDVAGEFFPLATHAQLLNGGSPDQALQRLVAAVAAHIGDRFDDDMALVLAERR